MTNGSIAPRPCSVLIVYPDASRLGGVEAYFAKLLPHLTVSAESFGIARRPDEAGAISRLRRIAADFLRYWRRLGDPAIRMVHLNPSLEPKSFFREALFLALARLRGKAVLVFFHGWSPEFEQWLDRWGKGRLLRLLYGRADAFVVLATRFAAALRRWSVTAPIHSEVILIEDDVLGRVDMDALLAARSAAPRVRILFASRLMRTKGILVTLQALQLLREEAPGFELLVAGDGEARAEAEALARTLGLRNVRFLGIVSGSDKYALFRDAHLLCLPTTHGEGFPNVIVEAMAFGMPVVTRPVGGIPELFEDGVHGFMTPSLEPHDFAALLLRIARDREAYRRMALASHAFARNRFPASAAAQRMDRLYSGLIAARRAPGTPGA